LKLIPTDVRPVVALIGRGEWEMDHSRPDLFSKIRRETFGIDKILSAKGRSTVYSTYSTFKQEISFQNVV
jgi:hypothetical protein